MTGLYLGLDVGTQSTKAVLYCHETRSIVSRGSLSYDIIPSDAPGRAEQHPDTWIKAVVAATQQAVQAAPPGSKVLAAGVSGQQHGMVVLDQQLAVLRPAKLWCDTESAPEAQELSQQLGVQLVASITLTKLLWLKRHEPEVWSRVAHVLLPHDYVNWWLTGRLVMEAGDASGTGCLDVRARCWDAAATGLVDPALQGWLPPLIGPDEPVGKLRPEAAAALGLSEEVVVAPGSGDNAMSALGAGACRSGDVVVSLGTSGTLFAKSDTPILDPSGTICPFCDATGGWLPLLCTLNCTRVPEEVRQAWGLSQEDATRLAAQEPAGCEGLVMLPYLLGERTPNWPHASGAILGLKPGLLRPGLLYRAALEGATLSLAAGLGRAVALGLVPAELRLVGGGSRNALWRQIVADVFQLPVRLPLEADSAALGGALQAAACHRREGVGAYVAVHQPPVSEEVVQPNPANKEVYARLLEQHIQQGERLFGKA